jgi:hypothetical protein
MADVLWNNEHGNIKFGDLHRYELNLGVFELRAVLENL